MVQIFFYCPCSFWAFFGDPNLDFPDRIRILWLILIRTQEKKSDPDPDKITRIRNTGRERHQISGRMIWNFFLSGQMMILTFLYPAGWSWIRPYTSCCWKMLLCGNLIWRLKNGFLSTSVFIRSEWRCRISCIRPHWISGICFQRISDNLLLAKK